MSSRLWKLLQLNVLYTNGKVVSNKMGKTSSLNTAFYMQTASFLVVLLLGLFLGFTMFPMWNSLPEMFFFQTGNMLLMCVGLMMFYSFSTLFKSRDFEQYLYYPYTKVEVFYGKLASIFFMFAPFLLLIGAIGFSFGLAIGGFGVALLQTAVSLGLGILCFLLTVGVVFYIGTHRILKKLSSVLLGVGMVIFLGTLLIFSGSTGFITGQRIDDDGSIQAVQSNITNIPIASQYYEVMTKQPFMLLVVLGIVVVLCWGIFLLLKKRALHNYLQNVLNDTSTKKDTKVTYKSSAIGKALFSHNMKIVTANKQYVMMMCYMQLMPIFMIVIPLFGVKEALNIEFQAINTLSLSMLIGVAQVLVLNLYTVSENLYSLERENLDYMLALPLTRKRIFQEKQRFTLLVTTLPFIVYSVILLFILKMGVLQFVVLLLSSLGFNYLYQLYCLLADEKHPNVNWSSEMDLLQGGMQTFMRVIRYYGVLIAMTICIALSLFTMDYWYVGFILLIIVFLSILWLLRRYQGKRNL